MAVEYDLVVIWRWLCLLRCSCLLKAKVALIERDRPVVIVLVWLRPQ